ncbi:MAG: putative sulfatase [Verrucomicrobiota bacterium]|nr:putative sulfatase [Verrucomicrobiota bacterium]
MSAPKRPNVIVFFTDQQRADTTGAHGYPFGLTPNFDRMAATGTHVAHSYTCQPVCGPARSCLQTGYYATQTGVWKNGFRPDPKLPTLAQHFNAAGYHTGYIGKWHLAEHKFHGAVPRELQGGYQTWLGANLLEFVSDAYDTHLWDQDGREQKLPGYRVDAITDAAIRHVDARTREDKPFFLFLSYIEPHHQNHRDDYPAPVGYEQQYATAPLPPDLAALKGTAPQHWPGYCGMIKRLDESLGRLFDSLRSLGQLENTIVLYTCDHGCHFKTRNGEYKRSCHDASIRVPTALVGPGFNGGGRLENLVSLVDLPPTLLDAAGIAVPGEMPGRSIKPLAQKRLEGAWPEEVFVQISESHTGRCIRTARWKYSVRAPGNDAAGKPVSLAASDVYEDDFLYDLQADPWEQTNLIGMPPFAAVVADLRARLVRRMTAIGEHEPRFIDAPPRDPFQRQVEYYGGSGVS